MSGAGAAASIRVSPRRLDLAAWMVKVMLADGIIDDKEMAIINDYAEASLIPKPKMQQIIDSMKAGTLDVEIPTEYEEMNEWLMIMAGIALADGKVSGEEKTALLALGKHSGFTKYDINQIIQKKRSEIYKQTKAQMKSYA